MTKELASSINWSVPPSAYDDIAIVEEQIVLYNSTEGVIVILYRSGEVMRGMAMTAADAKALAEALIKNANQVNLKAN